jgi:hypothetical protein
VRDKHDYKHYTDYILLISFILKMFYAIKKIFCVTDHDLQVLEVNPFVIGPTGHLGYINYIIEHLSLPPVITEYNDFPPQFYHPPVFYVFGALVKGIAEKLGVPEIICYEILQQLNMVFAFLCIYVLYKILNELKISAKMTMLLMLLVAFSPIYLTLGVEINNDCIMTLFCLLAVHRVIIWYKKRTLKDIVLTGLFLALGILSKTSAVLISPALGAVFACAFFEKGQNSESRKKLAGQYGAFLAVSVPLGLSWVIRNYVMYKVPFSYVPAVVGRQPQYTGDIPVIARLGLPSMKQLTLWKLDIFHPEDQPSILGQIIQSQTFDEGLLLNPDPVTPMILLWSYWLLYLFAFYLLVRFVADRKIKLPVKLLLGLLFAVPVASIYMFAFQYPALCSVSARYIAAPLTMLFVAAGYFADKTAKKWPSAVFSAAIVFVTAFSVIDYVLF